MAKKIKLSTHLRDGPTPAACKISNSMSPNNPNRPPDDFFPKQTQVLRANGLSCSSPWSLTMTPGHCSGVNWRILYALATSRHAPKDPGGSDQIKVAMVAKVPQVQGYKSVAILELIERT